MSDKALLVCGGFSDFGLAFIKQIYGDYSTIFVHCSSNEDRYETNGLKDLDTQNKIIVVAADFSSEIETIGLIDKISSYNRPITHFVHFSSPPLKLKKFPQTPWAEYQSFIDVGLRSNVILLSHFLPLMEQNQGGSVVIMLTDSVKGLPPKYCSHYVTAKYAMLGLVNSLAAEYAGTGININAISPGTTQTKFFGKGSRLFLENSAMQSPIKRNLEVSEVVTTAKFLLSDEAKAINGVNIFVNGGAK